MLEWEIGIGVFRCMYHGHCFGCGVVNAVYCRSISIWDGVSVCDVSTVVVIGGQVDILWGGGYTSLCELVEWSVVLD